MKKVLFATTALVAMAGAAAAEVKLSGYAEMGIQDGNGAGIDTRFHTDIDVKFSLSGMTDGGLEFGATIDLDEEGGFAATNGGPESVWIKGDFGSLTMGDTDGAFDWAMKEVFQLTTINDDHSTHAGASGNSGLDGSTNGAVGDGLVARYDYSFGAFAVAASAEIDSDAADDNVLGLGFKYSGDMGGTAYGVGIGYQTNGVNNLLGLSADVAMNGFSAGVNYSDLDGFGGNDSHMAIGVGYTTGALSLSANWGKFEATNGTSTDGYGLAVNYDLGGGAVVMAGYGHGDAAAGNGNGDSTWSLGLGLSF